MILGCFAFFTSTWFKGIDDDDSDTPKPHEICDHPEYLEEDQHCPDIALERFFVSMTIICAIGSLVSLISACCCNLESSRLIRWIDAIFHLLRAVLLAGGAVFFAVSAELVNDIFPSDLNDKLEGVHFRRWEKMAAAVKP